MDYLHSAISTLFKDFEKQEVVAEQFIEESDYTDVPCEACDDEEIEMRTYSDMEDDYDESEIDEDDLEDDTNEDDDDWEDDEEDDDWEDEEDDEGFDEEDFEEHCVNCDESDIKLWEQTYIDSVKSYIEGVKSSTIKRKKKQKRAAFAGKASMAVANKKGDPLYKKYKRYRSKAMMMKKKLMKKYSRKGMRIAKKRMR